MKRILFAVLLAAAPAFADRYDRSDDDQARAQEDWSGGYGDERYDWAESDGTEGSWQTANDSAYAEDRGGPTFDDFRNDSELSWYGDWVDTPEYGRVWRPTHVGDEWQPYLYGRWVWTRAGWAWASDEPFGWAVYHYGRWAWSPAGWMWVPGRVWAPAWVAWRWSDGYAAWCPLGPRSVVVERPALWVVVPTRHFLEPVRHVVVPRPQRQGLQLPPRPGPRAGPAVTLVERAIGRKVRPLDIGHAGAPSSARAGSNSVDFYRPRAGPVATQPRAVAPSQTRTLRPVPQGPRAVAPPEPQAAPQGPRAGRLGGFSNSSTPAQPQARPNQNPGSGERGQQAQPHSQGPKAVPPRPDPETSSGKGPGPHASAPIPRSNPEQPQEKER